MQNRPEAGEYAPYYSTYVNLVPEGDIIHILNEQIDDTKKLLNEMTNKQALFKYGPDKWSIKEVIGHITDTERIMGYRLLCIARGETVSLPGYDDQEYVKNASFNKHAIQDLLEDFQIARKSTVQLLKRLESDEWLRKGSANNSQVTVRAIAYIIAGHERHHRQIIKERYLNSQQYPIA